MTICDASLYDFGPELSAFVGKNYPDFKGDLYAGEFAFKFQGVDVVCSQKDIGYCKLFLFVFEGKKVELEYGFGPSK